MTGRRILILCFVVSCCVQAKSDEGAGDTQASHNWPQWRGPLGTGVAPHADPPIHWSENENIRWKTAIPGGGHSTPIVWGDRVFVTTAVPVGDPLEPRYSGAPARTTICL